MKFNSFNWNLYKESQIGRKLIDDFATIRDVDDFTDLIVSICPDAGIDKDVFANILFTTYESKVVEVEKRIDSGEQLTDLDVWSHMITTGYSVNDEIILNPGDFRGMLDLVPFLSIDLYLSFPDTFVPYMFFTGFAELKRIFDLYGLLIPELPSKNDYESRCFYYLALNEVLLDFREEIGLTPPEFCGFLYGFAPNQVATEESPSTYNRVWISGGSFNPSEKNKTYNWGNNPMARRGDWMLLYELSPVSAITSMWQLVSDGCIDPFFQWNAQAAVKHFVSFPAITLKELKNDAYFSNHPLVRRNMQGVNGTALSAEDYNNLLRILSVKGFDISVLPKMDGIEDLGRNEIINLEKDVEEKLLMPLLAKFDLKEGRDYIRQLPIHAGRGHRIFPDFAIYYSDTPNEENAHILVEAKLDIRNEKELSDAFLQAKSYANLLNSAVIILCDKQFLYIYKRNNTVWDKKKYRQMRWSDLADTDNYSEVAQIFDRRNYE